MIDIEIEMIEIEIIELETMERDRDDKDKDERKNWDSDRHGDREIERWQV